jgi:hypothetical protein
LADGFGALRTAGDENCIIFATKALKILCVRRESGAKLIICFNIFPRLPVLIVRHLAGGQNQVAVKQQFFLAAVP